MVDYTDVGRDTGTKPVKVLTSHHEAFLHASQPLWRGGSVDYSREEYSCLQRGWGEGGGKSRFPWSKAAIFKPIHTHTHTANCCQAEADIAFCTKVPQRWSPRKRGFVCPLYTCVREYSRLHGKEMQLNVDNEETGECKRKYSCSSVWGQKREGVEEGGRDGRGGGEEEGGQRDWEIQREGERE